MSAPEISIVILSWNTSDLLASCLRALRADESRYTREIIVVDNASADGSADRVAAEFPEVVLIRNETNTLYAEGNNIGARAATGTYLCLLNSDTEVQPGALDGLRDFLHEHPDYAIAAPQLRYPDGRIQSSCNRIPRLADTVIEDTCLKRLGPLRRRLDHTFMADFDHRSSRDVEQPMGACVMMRRAEFAEVGMFDERLSLYFNDVDLCREVLARGRRIRFVAEIQVLHHQGASTKNRELEFGDELYDRNRRAYYRKRHGRAAAAFLAASLVARSLLTTLRILVGRKRWRQKRSAIGHGWRMVHNSLRSFDTGAGAR